VNILMLGGTPDIRQALNKLLGTTKHRLTRRKLDDDVFELYLDDFDMVLIDGDVCGCEQQSRLLEWVQQTKRKFPDMPMAVVNPLGKPDGHSHQGGGCEIAAETHDATPSTPRACGVSASNDGVWRMRCRLQELALNDAAALLRDACEHEPLQPVTFEYSGRS